MIGFSYKRIAKKNYSFLADTNPGCRALMAGPMMNKSPDESLRFMAPTEPGEYPYICSFPGHWAIMKGVMVVK